MGRTSEPLETPDGGTADGATMVVDGEVVAIPPAPPSALPVAAVVAGPLRARVSHVKPAAITCRDVGGPNLVRFKLREGVAAHFDESVRRIVADTGARLSTAVGVDLARASSLGDYLAPQFGGSAVELRALKAQAEAESGEETADLSLWFELGVGARVQDDLAATDRGLCDRVANVVNELNAMDTVEVAFAVRKRSVPSLPFLAQATDITPTTVSFVSGHLGLPSAGGMNSPDLPANLPSNWLSAYRGSSVGIVDVEWDFFLHEKFNATRVRTGFAEGVASGQNTGHAMASMGTAFGTARSAGSSGNPLYGTRGFAPEALRGFSGIIDGGIFGNVEDPAEAITDAGTAIDPGDVIFVEVQSGCFDGDNICDPEDTNADVADAINTVTNLGRIVVLAMGNGFQNGNGPGTDRGSARPSKAIYVAANNADGLTRIFYSNFGALVDLNAWGMTVSASAGLDTTGGACWLPLGAGGACGATPATNAQAYISDFAGTSSATAETGGAVGQMESLYEAIYQRRMGFTADRNATVLRDTARAGATLIPAVGPNSFGVQPDVYYTAMHVIPVTRFGKPFLGGTPAVLAPHREFLTTTFPASGATTTNSLFGGIRSTTPNAGVTLTERSVGMTTSGPLDLGAFTNNFSIAFRTMDINAATSQFQIIAAKENPRNYSVTLYPTSFGANAGKIEFSYLPSGSGFFCPVSSATAITNGAVHDVVIVFRQVSGGVPQIFFWIDGVFDAQRPGCTTAGPTTNTGLDQSVATLAANMEANSTVADIRLYRRELVFSEILGYHNGTL